MDLTRLSTASLDRLLAAIEQERLGFPLTPLSLESEGFGPLVAFLDLLNTVGKAGLSVLLRTMVLERRARSETELVWTGPENRASSARDTAVVLAELFDRASKRVLVAGFSFDHAESVLRPLHGAMARGVEARVFADQATAANFISEHWSFGPPFPELFGFVPAEGVYASLHAKTVVVDGRWVFATSANFTDRGQTRNVEVGLLVDDERLAEALEGQFVESPWFVRLG